MQDFKKLRVWHESVELAADIYAVTSTFPSTERFGITSQMRSAAVSISSNIAEGSGRASGADKARFLQIAVGSASDLESQLLVGRRLGMLSDIDVLLDQVDKVRRQLISLRTRVERKTCNAFLSHPLPSLPTMGKSITWCDHKPVWVGRVAVSACAECGKVDWFSDAGAVDHAEAMAYLFGSYDLIGHLEALGGPTSSVLAYVPPSQKKRKNLDALPKHVWLEVGPRLWLSHDGEVLLLATDHSLLIENLIRGA